jgi:hypothetical protein
MLLSETSSGLTAEEIEKMKKRCETEILMLLINSRERAEKLNKRMEYSKLGKLN